MSLFSKLFGGGTASAPEATATEHNGFRIYPEPIAEGGQHRVAARIEKEIDGEVKTHRMIRADTLSSRDAAVDITLAKAKSLIDQQGDKIFN